MAELIKKFTRDASIYNDIVKEIKPRKIFKSTESTSTQTPQSITDEEGIYEYVNTDVRHVELHDEEMSPNASTSRAAPEQPPKPKLTPYFQNSDSESKPVAGTSGDGDSSVDQTAKNTIQYIKEEVNYKKKDDSQEQHENLKFEREMVFDSNLNLRIETINKVECASEAQVEDDKIIRK